MRAQPGSTRERLLDAAEDLFARHGFAGASMRDIGQALGIANASIVYHFPSKRKLYAAVLGRIADSAARVVDAGGEESGGAAAQVHLLVERFLDWGEAHPGYVQLILREMLDNPARISRVRTLYLAHVVRAMRLPLERAAHAGLLPGMDPGSLMLQLIGSISYFIVAAPTVGRITGSEDLGRLRQDFRRTVHRVVAACLAAPPAEDAGSLAGRA